MSSTTYDLNIFPPSGTALKRAAELLRNGQLVAFPTETVYGLGADARNDAAVKLIYKLKGRPSNNPLIVHCSSKEQISAVALIEPRSLIAQRLERLSSLMPGPLSVILPKHPSISMIATGGLNTVAVRIPSHPVALALINQAKMPIAAPSANPSNYISPTTAGHVAKSFAGQLEMILDGGKCSVGIESTVLSLVSEHPMILRPGTVTKEELSVLLGEQVVSQAEKTICSPGQLPLHYAPQTRCALLGQVEVSEYPSSVGLIQFSGSSTNIKETLPGYQVTATLSETGSLHEAATKLYAILREFDEQNLDLILIEPCALEGIGEALMDRINRATNNADTSAAE
jgi:L-threonylcarbamoyladenylate synthase